MQSLNKYLNQIIEGDCRKILKDFPDGSVDCVCSDVPYNIATGGVDSGYRDEVKLAITNFGSETVCLKDAQRIAQFMIIPRSYVHLNLVCDNENFRYGDRNGGIGSTGDILMGSNGRPYIIGIDTGSPIVQGIEDVEPMQCTGLRDKNDKLIYEGDVIKEKWYSRDDEKYRECLYSVEYDKEKMSYCFVEVENGFKNFFVDTEYIQEDYEIIGNIYENKELLGGANANI